MLALLIGASAFGQDQYDELMLAGEQYEGSARTMAMGGAFTALGGDLGAIAINPAGSAVFTNSQFSITPSLNFHNSSSAYLDGVMKGTASRLNIANAGFVLSINTGNSVGLTNYNFSITLNRKANFNAITRAGGATSSSSYVASLAAEMANSGIPYNQIDLEIASNPFNAIGSFYWPHILMYNAYMLDLDKYLPADDAAYIPNTYSRDVFDDLHIPGELNQEVCRKTRGGIDEMTLNFGGNISDKLYFGISLNLEDVHYTVEESMSEYSTNPGQFDTGFDQVITNYWRETSGVGINTKFGLIYTPVQGLRLGATFTTPTFYDLTDNWDYTVYSYFDGYNPDYQNCHMESPRGVNDWTMWSPMRFSLGAAYVIGKGGLISADYERVNYSSIWDGYNAANTFKLGAEARVADMLSLRAGFAHYGSPRPEVTATNLISGGLGFNLGNSFSIDIAYQQMLKTNETFQLYNDYYDIYQGGVSAPVGTTERTRGKFSLTLNWRF